jgi:hypothetical protein
VPSCTIVLNFLFSKHHLRKLNQLTSQSIWNAPTSEMVRQNHMRTDPPSIKPSNWTQLARLISKYDIKMDCCKYSYFCCFRTKCLTRLKSRFLNVFLTGTPPILTSPCLLKKVPVRRPLEWFALNFGKTLTVSTKKDHPEPQNRSKKFYILTLLMQ